MKEKGERAGRNPAAEGQLRKPMGRTKTGGLLAGSAVGLLLSLGLHGIWAVLQAGGRRRQKVRRKGGGDEGAAVGTAAWELVESIVNS